MCETFWNSHFLHYYFFGIVGPIIGGLIVVVVSRKLGDRYMLKAAGILALASLIAFIMQIIMTARCEILVLGESNDRISDIGLVIITLPIFFVFFMFSFAGIVVMHSLKIHSVGQDAGDAG